MFDKKVVIILFISMIAAIVIALLTDIEMNDEKNKALFIYKTHTKEKFNLIFAGDSRTYRGVSTDIIGNTLNMKAINLGYSSGGFGKDLLERVDELMDNSAKRKIIILGITPFSLTEKGAENLHLKGMRAIKKEVVLEYEYLFPIKNFFAPASPAKIRKNIKEKYYNKYRQDIHIKEGWIASWYDTPFPYLALKEYKKTFSETKISQQAITNLYSKIQAWRKKGIEVYGFFVPSSVNMVELEKNLGKFNSEQFLKGFLNAGGHWINLENFYTSYDGSHLDKESAIRLSNEIARKLKQNKIISEYKPDLILNDIYSIKKYNILKELYSNTDFKSIPPFEGYIDNTTNQSDEIILFKGNAGELIDNKIKKVEIQISVKYNDALTESILSCKIKNNKVELNTDYSTIPNQWCKLFLSMDTPDDLTLKDSICIYLDKPYKKEFFTDSLKIYYIAD
jgi:hypothetical protein